MADSSTVVQPGGLRRPPPCCRPSTCGHVFHCPTCGAGSAHPQDAANDYCGACGYQERPPVW
ncbi:hypothetical protein [Streptosporangium sp. CA-115845]|uniref:hypothetical protein n=1 Tax=Streptosporangium sp. CA-115845 TaxID=3240071 RepID=UPI003D920D35